MIKAITNFMFLFVIAVVLSGCDDRQEIDDKFTIAVIPDTQYYVDFTRQKNEGYPINAADLFIQQMEYVAVNSEQNGGEIVFTTAVGDIWQNYEIGMDEAHKKRGLKQLPRETNLPAEKVNAGVRDFELPLTKKGYDMIARTGMPFSVAPGNHDYQYWWTVNPVPNDPVATAKLIEEKARPNTHIGGYDTFNGVFGPDSHYFKDKDWYISSFNGGVNSAQIFEAGGYRFLHFAFEMQAGDDVLEWAQGVIDANPGLPTIMSTHDYLNPRGERKPASPLDLAKYDPLGHNSAEDIWNDWIKKNDQIFMILSGHHIGQSIRTDKNEAGLEVYQVLSDFQGRGKVVNQDGDTKRLDRTGDGWLRLMEFDFSEKVPHINVRTYSTYFKKYSYEVPEYVSWYRDIEQKGMSDQEFLNADHFQIELSDFKQRFGDPRL
ncbi:hypothetical protein [Pseudemcibacter aquimaris]|uniref:hypothetical protein n=1 Tax=Pseudemcibacter aquimaris TaxID=2857064 RepID=UPI002012AB0A|nr:hypothetical protein [Pseudemcibacter aquimaris]MCC3860967.1 hypothetical protein [Pseudemcibacter aquimaris]WDU59785.1 hypothetical protein KW060_05890 [Pseudemcibacter aquimaris]